jgi:hypothetical protein
MITAFLARITPPCRDVTRLASESMDRTLPPSTRIQLQLHYWVCKACAQYRQQLLALRQAARRSTSEPHAQEDAQLSSAAKARLKEALRARRD